MEYFTVCGIVFINRLVTTFKMKLEQNKKEKENPVSAFLDVNDTTVIKHLL